MIFTAIDIGGTFTDLIGFDDAAARFTQAKSLTTPHHLVQGIIDCIRKSGLEARSIDELIHGSTIAINTLIERKGAKTGLVVTAGDWGGRPGEDGESDAVSVCQGDYLLRLPGENKFNSMTASHHPVPVHAEVIVRAGGGGGWGDPCEHDPEAVRADVIEELISRGLAREDYGVVLRDDLSVDLEATATLRATPR